MKNSRSLELCHAWSKQQKHDYNVKYYKENKDKWKKYNEVLDKWKKEHARLGDMARQKALSEERGFTAKSAKTGETIDKMGKLVADSKNGGYRTATYTDESHMRAPVSAPTGSAGSPTINKAKRIAESTLKKAANSYKSAYEAGLSSLAKVGKNFINKIAYKEITYTVPGSDGWVSVKKVRNNIF